MDYYERRQRLWLRLLVILVPVLLVPSCCIYVLTKFGVAHPKDEMPGGPTPFLKAPSDISWDLTKSQDIGRLGIVWPNNADDVLSLKGPNTFQVITSEGAVSGIAASIHVWRKPNHTALVSAIDIHYSDTTLDNAMAQARTLITEFKPDDIKNSGWQAAIDELATWDPHFATFERSWDKGKVEFGVNILHSFDKTMPWFVSFHIAFLPH